MNANKLVSIVVPMYNETETAEIFLKTVSGVTDSVSAAKKHIAFEIIAVNDGSSDGTLDKLVSMQKVYQNLSVISLSRNFGQEPAVFAGLEKSQGDAVIVMDCDLQDPPELIPKMVDKWEEGCDVVNARRVYRKSDTKIKRDTAGLYYNILNKLSYKVKYPHNVNNFRLVSRRVIDIILNMPEKNKFYRGLVPFAGFKAYDLDIERRKRIKGVSKYNFKAMVRLAFEGIAATTVKPLSWAMGFGVFFSLIGLLGGAVLAVLAACGIPFNATLSGLLCGMSFFTGIMLIFTGINGFYIGKCYEEIKGRPFYIIDKHLPSSESVNKQN